MEPSAPYTQRPTEFPARDSSAGQGREAVPAAASQRAGLPGAAFTLVGRRDEIGALDRLLAGARDGHSGALVLRGEPGVGKTALVEYAVSSAAGFRVTRAAGVESEMELGFAALHQLCVPSLPWIEHLPVPQRNALGAAFGLSARTAPERFLVGLAALSLLSATAEKQPLLCVVEDAQSLDRESEQVLGFVARRLAAGRIAFLFATRERRDELTGLPELPVEGLDEDDARTLLASVIRGPLDARVCDRIIAETRGNPLALLELQRGLPAAGLAVGFALSPALPLAGRIEASFRRQVGELPAETQRLLLIASADWAGAAAKVWRAAELLGIGEEAAVPAEEAGLLDIDTAVRFRHPLVRSAVYRQASHAERRAVHQALAEAYDPEPDADRRAWHLAAGAPGLDERIAAELEHSAGRAQERGGLAAAAAFLDRSAQLTPDPPRQASRLLLAAAAHLGAGANRRAQELLALSGRHLHDPAARAHAMRMEGVIRFADGRGGDTPSLLLAAAMAFRECDPRLAHETLMEALEAAMWAAQFTDGTTVLDVAEALPAFPMPDGDMTTAYLLLRGYSQRLTTGYPAAIEWWRRAVGTHARDACGCTRLQLLGMAWNATGEMLDFESHCAIARERVRLAREEGALATLPVALSCLAFTEQLSGRIEAAEALAAEAIEITAATGAPAWPGAQGIMLLGPLAWRGREREARLAAEEVSTEASKRGQGLAAAIAQYFLTMLELGLGHYEQARAHALNVYEADSLYLGSLSLADVIEATVRSDDPDTAQAALARLSARARASGTPWALGLLARGSALLARDEDAEALYTEALDHLGRSGVTTELARAHLLYGEWLRRQRRRCDARAQLGLAHDKFQAMGAGAFAARASAELLATGERARRQVIKTRGQLTPQEHQVAYLAAEGEPTAEIAAQLFISPHTVTYHLRKVFAKLEITSRAQLLRALRNQPEATGTDA